LSLDLKKTRYSLLKFNVTGDVGVSFVTFFVFTQIGSIAQKGMVSLFPKFIVSGKQNPFAPLQPADPLSYFL